MSRIVLRGLQPGQNYQVQVRASDGTSVSEWSQLFDFSTQGDTVAPSAPSGLSWAVAGTAFKATWIAPTTNGDGSGAALKDLRDYQVTVFSSADTNTKAVFYTSATRWDFPFESNVNAFGTPRASVTIEVRARDHSGNLSNSATATATNPAPSNVTGLTVNGLQDAISCRWNAVSDSDLNSYEVHMSQTAGFAPDATTLRYSGRGTSFVFDTVSTATWYVKVRAVDVFNTPSTIDATGNASARSSLTTDSTPPVAVTNVTATPGFDTVTQQSFLDVSWTASTSNDVQSYVVRYGVSTTAGWSYIHVNGDTTSARINNLTSGQNYYVGVQAVDFVANESGFTNASTYPVQSAKDTVAPSTPEKPTVVSSTQRVQVVVSGRNASGANMEPDVVFYEVYYSTSASFVPSTSTMVGQIAAGPAMVSTFNIPTTSIVSGATAGSGSVIIIAVDRAGNKSAPSAATTAAPGLIDSTFIVDASIDNAKIKNLRADQLVAGAGLVSDFTVKSTLTLGDGTTAGAIKSFNYVQDVSGVKLSNTGLEVNNGSIAAAALKIQNSQNIMLPQYADFEFAERYYVADRTISGPAYGGINSNPAYVRSGSQSLIVTTDGTAVVQVYFSPSSSTYNHNVQELTTYIMSAWVYRADTSTFNAALQVIQDTGALITVVSSVPVLVGKWTRVSGTFTTAAGVKAIVPMFTVGSGQPGSVYVDQMQLEEKVGALTAPSIWKPPSHTSIDGGAIRTGEIRGNTLINVNGVDLPAWSLNTQGNMQVGDAQVRGRLIIGTADDTDEGDSYMASGNYSEGLSGYKVDSTGSVEFNDGTFRGTIEADGGSFRDMAVTGLLTTDPTQTMNRTEFDADGIRLITVDPIDPTIQNTLVNLPNDPDQDSSFQGNVIANSLTVQDQMSVRGKSNEFSRNSQTVLRNSVSAPGGPPTVIVDWQSAKFAKGIQYTGMFYDGTTGDYNFLGHYAISGATPARTVLYAMKPGETAPRTVGTFNTPNIPYGFVKLLNCWWSLEFKPAVGATAGAWYIVCYNAAFTSKIGQTVVSSFGTTNVPLATIGADNGSVHLLLAYNKNNVTTVWRENPNATTGTVSFVESYSTPQTIGSNSNLTWVGYGGFDFGSNRYVIACRANGDTGKVYTYTRSGTALTVVPEETFQIANKISATGFCWNGSVFVSHAATTGTFNYYTQNKWTTESSRWWFVYTWRQTTGGYETTRGSYSYFTMTKRARVTATAAPIPNSGDTVSDPNAVSFYAGRGTTLPTFYRQTNPAVGSRTLSYSNVVFSGTVVPTVNTFPASTPAIIQSESSYASGTRLLRISGDGNIYTNTLNFGDPGDTLQGTANWYVKNAVTSDSYQLKQYLYQGGSTGTGLAIVLLKNSAETARLELAPDGTLSRTVGGVNSPALFNSDTGWTNYPTGSGSTGSRWFRKVNGNVTMAFSFTRDANAGTFSGDMTLFSFSAADLPSISMYPGYLGVYTPGSGVSQVRTFLDVSAKTLVLEGVTFAPGGSITGKLTWPVG